MSEEHGRHDVQRVVQALEAGLQAAGYKFEQGVGVSAYNTTLAAAKQ